MFKPYTLLLPLLFGLALFAVPATSEAQPTVTLTVDDGSAAEAEQETGQFTITRSDDGNTAAALRVYLEAGGFAVRNVDYAANNLGGAGGNTYYLTLPANVLSQSVTLTPIRDNLIEGEEDATFTLLEPQLVGNDYLIGSPSEGEITISDDVAVVTLTLDDAQAAEAGQATASFTVTRSGSGNTAAALRVYLQALGSAQRNIDYSTNNLGGAGGSTYYLTLPANVLSQSVTLTPIRDNLIEDIEDVTFTLLGPDLAGNEYTIGAPSEGEISISDDVAVVTLTLDDGQAAEAGQATASFTVTRNGSGNTAAALRVYLQAGGIAQRNVDYTTTNLGGAGGSTYYLTLPANFLSQSVTVTPVFDEIEEGDENVTFTLLGPQLTGNDYTVGAPSQVDIIILDFVDAIFRDGFEQD